MPAHHNLEAYLEAAGIRDAGKTPFFRSAASRTGALTDKPMTIGSPSRPIGSKSS